MKVRDIFKILKYKYIERRMKRNLMKIEAYDKKIKNPQFYVTDENKHIPRID